MKCKPGDVIVGAEMCDRIPADTIVGFMHPTYQLPITAVRVERADKTLWWSISGRREWQDTETLLGSIKRTPLVVLATRDSLTEALQPNPAPTHCGKLAEGPHGQTYECYFPPLHDGRCDWDRR